MFRSFFPAPRLFFPSAVLWLLVTVLIWFTIGGQLRANFEQALIDAAQFLGL